MDTSPVPARYLPTYKEANVSYSLRLPAYRSTLIRRYHPYARYSISAHEKCMNTSDIDDSLDSLDLSVIYRLVQQSPMELTVPARARGQEQIELLPEQVHGVLSSVLQACESLNRSNIKADTTEA
ncbi:hypothetical protein M378DRAFT_6152 [Amanita muscaria Koide BX008]|uniref:Uncharacterized protein n=1 Tax=Amanita muscaria (strain Koide BX008) TaxID=946122 RepID=A0A0C2T5Z7_AMAMK|nr:hypothetical protein M378DRAFT_6152 [Amanita muscaria Koide BX008]